MFYASVLVDPRGVGMELYFTFRMPGFPVIIVRGDALFAADDPQSLVNIVYEEIQGIKDQGIAFFDSTGEEFKYFDKDIQVVNATMNRKNWTKKKIIELYNTSDNAAISNTSYSEKSLSAKTYPKIFNDIVDLIRENPPFIEELI